MSRSHRPELLLAACLAFPVFLHAQTTGGIVGRVTDADGGALPGVTVEATSPALQGSRTAWTDGSGLYRLALLPPGSYAVSFALSGFAHEGGEGIAVALDRDSTLNVVLTPTTADEITVVGVVPVVDTTSTTLGASLDLRAIETLPSGRNYASLAQVAPGTSSDANPDNAAQSTLTVYGSSGAENAYLIDGVNTTGVEYGFQGKELNFELIEALDVKTGGYEAEFGRSLGGIVNVVTKSGGNSFRGDLFAYHDSDSLQADAEPVVSTGGIALGFTRSDFGFDLGGFIVKDRLWFFTAYDRVDNETDRSLASGPRAGTVSTTKSERDLAAAKLTYNLAAGHTLVGSFFQDPRDDTGAISDRNHTLNGDPPTYLGRVELGGRDGALRYQGLFGRRWLATAQVARHEEENSVGPATAAGGAVQFRDVGRDFFQRGGFGLVQDKDFVRDVAAASLAGWLGRHEVKVGVELESQDATVRRRMTGGQRVDVFANPVDPSRPIYRHFYWTTPTATVDDAPIADLLSRPSHDNTALYLQDRWSVLPSLSLSVGVRWDRQEVIDGAGVRQIDLADDLAPRLGFVWDPRGDAGSRLYGSYGRYYEQLPMDLVIRSFSFERQPRIINYDPHSTRRDRQAEAELGTPSAILGGLNEQPADPDLEGQYLEELVLGYELQVRPELALGVRGIYRDLGQVIEDFQCEEDGTYCIGNPGRGIMREIRDLTFTRRFPAPEAQRVFRGAELTATRRFADGWQGLASYLYSELEGNYDGLYAPFTNVGADPNISAAFDYFDFFTDGRDLSRVTNRGPLSNDRRHQLKVSGYWVTPARLTVGTAAWWRSGTPRTRYGYSNAYNLYEYFLTRRGAEGRTPDNYEVDLHLGYPLPAGRARVHLLLDVFNLLDAQRPILLDQRWGFQEADNASPTPVNPGYGQPLVRTAPTSLRLGVRLSL